jgi:hypothetical protein
MSGETKMKHTFGEWYHMIVLDKKQLGASEITDMIHDWGEDRLTLDLEVKRITRWYIKVRDELMRCRNKNP